MSGDVITLSSAARCPDETLENLMSSFASVSSVVLAFGLLAMGCAAEAESPASPAEVSADALSSSKVKLPAGDTCRDVLAPLALGLADGAFGLSYANAITVSLTSETDTRLYTVAVTQGASSIRYEVELDNDSNSMCLLESIKRDDAAGLERDKRTSLTQGERNANVKVVVAPANDDCASVVKLLGQAAAVSAVGANDVQQVTVSLDSETEDRDYAIHVDGKSFQANGKTFDNDYDFTLNVSNDSASKCFVQSMSFK